MDVALELSRTNEQGKAKSGKGKLSFLIACGLYSVTALRGNDQERGTVNTKSFVDSTECLQIRRQVRLLD